MAVRSRLRCLLLGSTTHRRSWLCSPVQGTRHRPRRCLRRVRYFNSVRTGELAGLVDQLRNIVEADYEKLKGQLEERGEKIPASMETLYQTLKTVHAGSDGDDVIVTERYPTIFQITEQLSQQVA